MYASLDFHNSAHTPGKPATVHGERFEPSEYADIDQVATMAAGGAQVGHEYTNLDDLQAMVGDECSEVDAMYVSASFCHAIRNACIHLNLPNMLTLAGALGLSKPALRVRRRTLVCLSTSAPR